MPTGSEPFSDVCPRMALHLETATAWQEDVLAKRAFLWIHERGVEMARLTLSSYMEQRSVLGTGSDC